MRLSVYGYTLRHHVLFALHDDGAIRVEARNLTR